jgi:chorismate synthase
VGVVIDGCPPRIPIDITNIQNELDRRKPGQSRLTTPRKEDDQVCILSGVFNGLSTGAPIILQVNNNDQRSSDYDSMVEKYRPSHADATYDAKYGLRSIYGGGRSSARETVGRVAAGAVAKTILDHYCGLQIVGYVKKVQDIEATVDENTVCGDMVH